MSLDRSCLTLSPSFSDTSTQNYFKNKTKTSQGESEDDFPVNNSMDVHNPPKASSVNHQESRNVTDKDKFNDTRLAVNYRPSLTKTDSIDLDCESINPLMKISSHRLSNSFQIRNWDAESLERTMRT